jgi:putative ABC transport system substrate-binding protein
MTVLIVAVDMTAAEKIVVLKSGTFPQYDAAAAAFSRCLKKESVDFTVDSFTLPEGEKARSFFSDIRASSPDLVFALGSAAAISARQEFTSIPVVFALVTDDVTGKLVSGGVCLEVDVEAQLRLISRTIPSFKKVGVIINPAKNERYFGRLQRANVPGVQVVIQKVSSVSEMDEALRSLKVKADCILMVPDGDIYNGLTLSQIFLQSIQMGLPFVVPNMNFVKAGAVLGLYADVDENGCLAAGLAKRYLIGNEKVGALPVVYPDNVKVAVNKRMAERMGISIPASTLSTADVVQ